MADIRINGTRFPSLQSLGAVNGLLEKLENLSTKTRESVTMLRINDSEIDISNDRLRALKLDDTDKVEVKMETPEKLSYESLNVALDMADLLMNDIKVSTLNLWNSEKDYEPTLETLIDDSFYFLSLAARPIYLLDTNINNLDPDSEKCIKQLDKISDLLKNVTYLSIKKQNNDACHILVAKVIPAIETWIGLSGSFADNLNLSES